MSWNLLTATTRYEILFLYLTAVSLALADIHGACGTAFLSHREIYGTAWVPRYRSEESAIEIFGRQRS